VFVDDALLYFDNWLPPVLADRLSFSPVILVSFLVRVTRIVLDAVEVMAPHCNPSDLVSTTGITSQMFSSAVQGFV
jgi:hypothetical protein